MPADLVHNVTEYSAPGEILFVTVCSPVLVIALLAKQLVNKSGISGCVCLESTFINGGHE